MKRRGFLSRLLGISAVPAAVRFGPTVRDLIKADEESKPLRFAKPEVDTVDGVSRMGLKFVHVPDFSTSAVIFHPIFEEQFVHPVGSVVSWRKKRI